MPSLFVIGGARSGKSRYAQERAENTGLAPFFIATAQTFDDEMRDRIARHQADRGSAWQTFEAPIKLAESIRDHDASDRVILVDCLTLWVGNLMLSGHDIPSAVRDLRDAMITAHGTIILVSNEVGCSIVPENALTRRFRDEAGRVNQQVAASAGEVQVVMAGISLRLK